MQTRNAREPVLRHALLGKGYTNPIDDVMNHASLKSTYGCALQLEKHIGMGVTFATRMKMSRTPDEKRELLRQFISRKGLRIAAWAKQAGVGKNSIYNFMNGHSDGLDLRTYAKLARAAGVPSWELSGERPEVTEPVGIWVCGHVQAGDFREAVEWIRDDWYHIDVPVPERFRRMAKALEVRGTSMNLEFREGAIVIWVSVLDARPPRDGDHVIVYSRCDDGRIEATVKLLRILDGKKWLWPQSDDPEHQQPIDISSPPKDVTEIEIVGLVIGDYRARLT